MTGDADDPLGILARGFGDPQALRGEQGVELAIWLAEDGTEGAHLAAARQAIASHVGRERDPAPDWRTLREELTLVACSMQEPASDRYVLFMLNALRSLAAPGELAGFLNYLDWLTTSIDVLVALADAPGR